MPAPAPKPQPAPAPQPAPKYDPQAPFTDSAGRTYIPAPDIPADPGPEMVPDQSKVGG